MFHDSALYLRLTGEWFPMELHLGLSGHYVQYLLLMVILGALDIPTLHIPQFTVKLWKEYYVQSLVLTVAYYLWFDVTEIRLVVE